MAILGHKPSRVLTELKNTAERGLFACFPHPAEKRFLKALARLFPPQENGNEFCFRLYNSNASLKASLEPVMQVGSHINNQNSDFFWRPFRENALLPLFVPILPWVFSPRVLVLEKSLESRFPPGDLLSPLILVPTARAIYDLIAVGKDGGRPSYPRLKKALSGTGSKWQRQGIYLYRDANENEDWKQLWTHFLEKGFLLPPNSQEPLILPGILSVGEEAKLAKLLEE
jgi:hypothetical protein